mgnify:FL=1
MLPVNFRSKIFPDKLKLSMRMALGMWSVVTPFTLVRVPVILMASVFLMVRFTSRRPTALERTKPEPATCAMPPTLNRVDWKLTLELFDTRALCGKLWR